MITLYIEEQGKYYSICDDCGYKKEVQRQTYKNGLKKDNNYCRPCSQIGDRNHRYGQLPWNYGLTSETDERVRDYSKKQSITKQGHEPWNKGYTYTELKGKKWAKEFSRTVSKAKIGVPNLKRRGLTTNYAQSYRNIRSLIAKRLYRDWTFPILERDNFFCTNCGSHNNLEVHHLEPFTFRNILDECIDKMGLNLSTWKFWDTPTIETLVILMLESHELEYGITLCKNCHCEIDKCRNRLRERN